MEQGDPDVAGELLPVVYAELKKLAAAKMSREREAFTLQPTALVHEAWLRLGGDQQPGWRSRSHFFAAAAEAMRRILIDHARRRKAARRGAGVEHLRLDATGFQLEVAEADSDQLLLISDALEAFAGVDPRRAELVKQRYFGGLTFEELAELHDLSPRTLKRDWAYARAWLFDRVSELRDGRD